MRPHGTSASPLAVWAGIVVLYFVWGSTYLGIKVAIETIPPFLMGFIRFVIAGVLLAGAVALYNRRSIRRPTLTEARDTAIVGGLLLHGRHGPRRLGRADRPVGDRRAAHRPHADVARDLRASPVRRPAAGARDRRHRHRPRRRRDPRLAGRRGRRRGPRGPRRPHRLADLLVARVPVRGAPRGPAAARPVRERPRDDRRRARAARRGRAHGRARDIRRRAGVCTASWAGIALPRDRRQPRRLHDLHLAPRRRPPAPALDLRLCQPGRGGRPGRLARPGAVHAADDRGVGRDRRSRSCSSSPRGAAWPRARPSSPRSTHR